jgi:acetoacetyl-CoA reductase
MKVHTATAGLGGEFGAFTYIVPENSHVETPRVNPFRGDIALVTGITGGLGFEVAKNLARKGADLILHYNSNEKKAKALVKELDQMNAGYELIKSDFSKPDDVKKMIGYLNQKYDRIDYIVHTAAITGSLNRASDVTDAEVRKVAQVNQLAPVMITKALIEKVKKAILYTGSVAEDAQFSGSSSYVSSKQGLHGFAASFAGEAHSLGIRSIYYMIGVMDGGMAELLTKDQIRKVMMSIGQKRLYSPEVTAERVVNSLIRPKIMNTYDTTEGVLLVRRDGYKR